MSEQHNRREGYWPTYRAGRKTEQDFMRHMILTLIRLNPPPTPKKKSNRGCKRTHSREKLYFLCIMKVATGVSFDDVIDELKSMPDDWQDEPKPDSSWIKKIMKTIDLVWLDSILVQTAKMCLEELKVGSGVEAKDIMKQITCESKSERKSQDAPKSLKGPTAPLASDSSGVETDRYETIDRFNPATQEHVQTDVKTYYKYHITGATGHQIVFSSHMTSNDVTDMEMYPVMLSDISRNYPELDGRSINADRGYDSDDNVKKTHDVGLNPNIKQRIMTPDESNANRNKPHRKKAAETFDPKLYKHRSLIEGVFGAEETRNHRLHCRMRLVENRKRFGKLLTIAWNIRVLNRFICAHLKGYKIPSYGLEDEMPE